MDFKSTLDEARASAPGAFAVVRTESGEFVAVSSAGDEREVKRLFGGTTVWFR